MSLPATPGTVTDRLGRIGTATGPHPWMPVAAQARPVQGATTPRPATLGSVEGSRKIRGSRVTRASPLELSQGSTRVSQRTPASHQTPDWHLTPGGSHQTPGSPQTRD